MAGLVAGKALYSFRRLACQSQDLVTGSWPLHHIRPRLFISSCSLLHSMATPRGQPDDSTPVRTAYIALGSNIGDRIGWIERACREMDARGIKVKRTSSLWETEPMYVHDQDKFVNGACEVETSLEPLKLLDELQDIERSMGRQKVIDKGPRNIDLDILLYDNVKVDHPRLKIPHVGIPEREFVLRPLAQLIPARHIDPEKPWRLTVDYLAALPPSPRPMTTIVPLSASLPPLRPLDRGTGTRTHVMAVLNLTPDSFSDGGTLPPLSGPGSRSEDTTGRFASHVASLVAAGATILDVGGQSTRPGAAEVSADEELARILPAIRAIRALPGTLGRTTISVDTYRASVAAAAVAAGADIVNDVSAGRLDPDMLPTVARLGCTVILMHSRGNPTTMGRLNKYPAGGGKGDGLVDAVASELADRVRAAEEAGIRRWRMILDPGLGFAKVGDQNLELLAGLPRLIGDGAGHHILYCMPWLVGPSRKSFVGRAMLGRPGVERRKGSGSGSGDSAATSSDEQYMAESVPAGGAGGAPVEMARPRDRAWGTAATVAAAVAGGADIVRVHDVKEMVQVVRVSDGIWRRG